MSVLWKCTLIYPKWLHNQCKVSIKWPKVTHRYPSWTQSDPRLTSKWPQRNPKLSTLACRSHHFGDFGTPKSPVWPFWRLWRAKSCHFADFGAQIRPKSAFCRFCHPKVAKSCFFGDFGVPKPSNSGLTGFPTRPHRQQCSICESTCRHCEDMRKSFTNLKDTADKQPACNMSS